MYKNEHALNLFNSMAKMGVYYGTARPVHVPPKWIAQDVFSKIGTQKHFRILDAGCGTGLLTVPLAKASKTVFALDGAKKPLSLAQKTCRDKKIDNVNFTEGLITDLPFKDHFFDRVVCYAVIHYLEDHGRLARCIQELIRVCKPGGRVLIGEIPDYSIIDAFSKRAKTKKEERILSQYLKGRTKYDMLFKRFIDHDPGASPLKIDLGFVLEVVRAYGCKGQILKQDIRLPVSLTRRDLLITKPV